MNWDEVKEAASLIGFQGDLKQLGIGMDQEWKEHSAAISKYTRDGDFALMAASIAADHLREDPQYYSKMEQLKLQAYRPRVVYEEYH
jgi:hypothetical protein